MINPRSAGSACIAIALLWSSVGCHRGQGSDIGPNLGTPRNYDYRALVRDDAGRPVTGAQLRIAGAASTPATGSSGRAFMLEALAGNRLITVDGNAAASTATSQLGSVAILASLPDGDELPYVVYLPDHSTSAGMNLSVGVQGAPVILDDSGNDSGAILTVNTGDAVSFGGAATVEVRTARLSVGHLPPVPGVASLTSRAVYVHPAGVQFSGGARLSIPDDLDIQAATVTLFWLDPATGLWTSVGTATRTGTGPFRIEAAFGSVTRGGLYCFGATPASTSSISGRVLNQVGTALDGVLVRAPMAATRTLADGTFTLPIVARLDLNNVERTVPLEFDGGRNDLPEQATQTVLLDSANVSVGDVTLDTVPSTNLRMMLIHRGRSEVNRRLRVSGRSTLVAGYGNGGANGVVEFEDLAADSVGYVTTTRNDIYYVNRTAGSAFVFANTVDNIVNVYSARASWRLDGQHGTLLSVVDKHGTGTIYRAQIVLGGLPAQGYEGETSLVGTEAVSIPRGGQVTAAMQTTSEGRTVTSAFTMVGSDSGSLEMPVERALRQNIAGFRRFGMRSGSVLGTASGKTHDLRVSGGTTAQEFFEETVLGEASNLRRPKTLTASGNDTVYRVGVPLTLGHLIASEGTTGGGVFSLERIGMAMNLNLSEGVLATGDIPMPLLANAPFTLSNVLIGRSAAVAIADLRFDLAGQLPSGLVADIARQVGGASITGTAGSDATIMVPTLPAAFDRYLVSFGGSATTSGLTTTQRVFLPVDGVTTPTSQLLPAPVVASPAVGATVSNVGFNVDFTVPAECHYIVVQLRTNDNPNDVRDWTAVIPYENTSFNFHLLPTQVPAVLAAARNWTLTVSCARVDNGLLVDPLITKSTTYARILAQWVGLREAERQVAAVSSVSFSVTTN